MAPTAISKSGPSPQERLAISELQLIETLAWALEVCPVGNFCFSKEGMIIRASAEVHRLTGRAKGSLDGLYLKDLLSPALLKERPSILERAFAHRQERETVFIHRIRSTVSVMHRSGKEEPVSILVIEPPAGRADELAFAYILPDEGIPDE